jgi:hypothetical protein
MVLVHDVSTPEGIRTVRHDGAPFPRIGNENVRWVHSALVQELGG